MVHIMLLGICLNNTLAIKVKSDKFRLRNENVQRKRWTFLSNYQSHIQMCIRVKCGIAVAESQSGSCLTCSLEIHNLTAP